ncbi:influenza virus NS1A-binding protein homolog isoform X2 [Lycorma delicatula]
MVEQIKGLVYQDDQLPSQTLHSLNMMRKNRTFCDVILHVGNAELHGHRAVLASASPYFLELFTADDEQKGNIRENVITYQLNGGFDKFALEKIIDYVYTAKLDVSANHVKQVYLTAIYLKMEKVARECAQFLIQQLNVDNCIEIRSLPSIARNKDFVSQVDNFIMFHFEPVSKSSVLLALPCIQIEVLNQTRQEMSLMTCDSICHLVLDWIKRSSEDFSLETMTQKTHLLYLALDNSLQDCTELPSNDVSNTEIVQDYKRQSKKNSVANQSKNRRKTQMQPAKPRVLVYSRDVTDNINGQDKDANWLMISSMKVAEHTFLALIVADSKLATLSVLLRLNLPFGSPSPQLTPDVAKSAVEPDLYCGLSNMTSVKCAAGCANLNDSLLVCGGYDRAECLRSVEIYNPLTNTWKELPPMKDARGRFNIAVVNGKVYAIGGCNGTTELATVECFGEGNWKRVTPLPLARSNTGVCSLDGRIYCIGGWNGQVGIRQCDVFDPESQTWTSIAPLQTGRYQAGVCSFENKVWVAGGCDSWNCLRSVEVYDPATDTWIFAAPMITARRGCGVTVYKGKLYAVGGSDGAQSLNTTEVYNPEDKSWSPGPSMTTSRSNVGVAVIDGRLYAVGGFSGKNFLNTIEYLDDKTDEWTTFSLRTQSTPPSSECHDTTQISDVESNNKSDDCIQQKNEIKNISNNYNNKSVSASLSDNHPKNLEKSEESGSLLNLIGAEPKLSTS